MRYLADAFELSNLQFHEWESHFACMTPVGVEALELLILSGSLQGKVWCLFPPNLFSHMKCPNKISNHKIATLCYIRNTVLHTCGVTDKYKHHHLNE